MADNIELNGFRWRRSLYATGNNEPPTVRKSVATGYQFQVGGSINVDVSPGDPLQLVSDGTVGIRAGTEGTPGVIFGVVKNILPYWSAAQGAMVIGTTLPGGTAWGTNESRRSWINVIPVFGQIFEIDVSDSATATTFATYLSLTGNNADHILTAVSGETTAQPKLDIATAVGTGTAQWRIWDISETQENVDLSGANVKLEVMINEGQGAEFSTTGV